VNEAKKPAVSDDEDRPAAGQAAQNSESWAQVLWTAGPFFIGAIWIVDAVAHTQRGINPVSILVGCAGVGLMGFGLRAWYQYLRGR